MATPFDHVSSNPIAQGATRCYQETAFWHRRCWRCRVMQLRVISPFSVLQLCRCRGCRPRTDSTFETRTTLGFLTSLASLVVRTFQRRLDFLQLR